MVEVVASGDRGREYTTAGAQRKPRSKPEIPPGRVGLLGGGGQESSLVMAPPVQRAVLRSRREIGGQAFELTFEPLDEPVFYRPGQWLPFHLPVSGSDALVRAYSMAEPMREDARLRIALDVVHGGVGSAWLAACEPGREVRIGAAQGTFTMPAGEGARPALMVGRGTGVVPLRCLALDRLESPGQSPAPTVLIHDGSGVYGRELVKLAHEAAAWLQLRESAQEARAALDALATLPDPVVMVAGIRAMALPLRTSLRDLGLAPVRCELFD